MEDYIPGDGEQEAFTLGADIIVDALFGVGLNSPLREPGASAVRLMNLSDAKVVSADVPSGVETDTGRILGDAVRADVTVTFSMAKPGLFVGKGALRAGKVVVHDIGIPRTFLEARPLTPMSSTGDWSGAGCPAVRRTATKETSAGCWWWGGSTGVHRARRVLCARGALRSGAGL